MPDHLMGVSEVAGLLGVTRQRVTQLADGDFPEPVAVLASGRIWESSAIDLWAQANRNRPKGRPRGGYRIEHESHHIVEDSAYVVSLNVRATDDADLDSTFQRKFNYTMGKFVEGRLAQQLPPAEADTSLWRTMAGLATLQLRREIEAVSQQLDQVAYVADMEDRWTQYLESHATGMRHPIPPLRSGEVLHLWVHPIVPDQLTAASGVRDAMVDYVHVECRHWIDRDLIDGEISLFVTEVMCPTCRSLGRVVGLWPQR